LRSLSRDDTLNRMKADLHVHSDWSDGTLSPSELVRNAADAGLEGLALTDHDTMAGLPEFLDQARAQGVNAWAGVEIDCTVKELAYRSEILAYFPESAPAATASFLAKLRVLRLERTKGHVEDARRLFGRSDLSFNEMEEGRLAARPAIDAGGLSWSRLDVYRYLARKGAIPESTGYREFRKAFFDSGLLRDGKYRKPTLAEAMAPIKADGGFAVIPHPGHVFGDDPERLERERPRLVALLERFREEGVRGIEVYAYALPSRNRLNEIMVEVAARMGFEFTFGSDCHGPGSGRTPIGSFYGAFDGFPWDG